jgi:hypothetical protein
MNFYKLEKLPGYCCWTDELDEMNSLHFLVSAKLEIKNEIEVYYVKNKDIYNLEDIKVTYKNLEESIDKLDICVLHINEEDYCIVMSYGELWVYAYTEEKTKSIYAQLKMLDNEPCTKSVERIINEEPKWFSSKDI